MWSIPGEPEPHGSLLREGAAMVRALTADFAALPGVSVIGLRDARLKGRVLGRRNECLVATAEEEQSLLIQLASVSDWTVLIAPELDGALLERAKLLADSGARLLSPPPAFIATGGNKSTCARLLRAAGLPVPRGIDGVFLQIAVDLPADFRFPAVWKRADGAGSVGVHWMADRQSLMSAKIDPVQAGRLEEFQPGRSASCSVLCGPRGNLALAPCEQILSQEPDSRFAYLGGRTPLPPPLAERASRLALAAIAALPPAVGYVGVDLVLGESAADDCLIEINPRLTTSYVGLRAACQQNLAQAMLDVAAGCEVSLSYHDKMVEFQADGTIGFLSESSSP